MLGNENVRILLCFLLFFCFYLYLSPVYSHTLLILSHSIFTLVPLHLSTSRFFFLCLMVYPHTIRVDIHKKEVKQKAKGWKRWRLKARGVRWTSHPWWTRAKWVHPFWQPPFIFFLYIAHETSFTNTISIPSSWVLFRFVSFFFWFSLYDVCLFWAERNSRKK